MYKISLYGYFFGDFLLFPRFSVVYRFLFFCLFLVCFSVSHGRIFIPVYDGSLSVSTLKRQTQKCRLEAQSVWTGLVDEGTLL